MSFQDNLKNTRERAGYDSAKNFAKSLEIPYSTYLGYENKGIEPKYKNLCKIAAALGVTTDELLGYTLDEYEKCCSIVYEFGYAIVEEGTTLSIIPKNGGQGICDYDSRDDFINDVHKATQNYKEQTKAVMHNSLHNIFMQARLAADKMEILNALEMLSNEKSNTADAMLQNSMNHPATHPTKIPTKKSTRRKKPPFPPSTNDKTQ